jgi:hypothetical protein
LSDNYKPAQIWRISDESKLVFKYAKHKRVIVNKNTSIFNNIEFVTNETNCGIVELNYAVNDVILFNIEASSNYMPEICSSTSKAIL